MSWLFERFTEYSEKNGVIRCDRLFGVWTVRVNGYAQSGTYEAQVFYELLQRTPITKPIKRVLILGLGAGNMIEICHARFPGVQVTVIEWDPAMVRVADRVGLFAPEHRPTVLIGDVTDVLPTLTDVFDMVVVDVFTGPDLAPIVFEPAFVEMIQRVSHPGTSLLVNAFRSQPLLDLFAQTNKTIAQWRYQYNLLGVFEV